MTASPIAAAMQRARAARRHYPAPAADSLPAHVPVAIVGAGPVGLAMAHELSRHGIASVVLEKGNTSSDGSRAICWSKRTLEILDRHGVAGPMLAKGVTWNIGRVFSGAAPSPLYSFDLLPIKAQKFPAFINLQQYYTEEYLVDALAARADTGVCWQHEVVDISQSATHVTLTLATPSGPRTLTASYVIAADGCRSPLRARLGLDFEGRTFEDNFLIADVRMKAPFPAERRFYFNAPFNEGRTALMHQQPDDVWRLDFQLGWDIDRDAALADANVAARVEAMLGPGIRFDYEWVSLYTFQCRRMRRFVHGRVVFAGDAAHLVSPFGARGANGGIQDVDNLAWKLAAILRDEAGPSLLASYDEERIHGADENLRNSTRATDFMTPKSAAASALQASVLELAADHPFARALVNSGRLSVPCSLAGSSLVSIDTERFETAGVGPGNVALDAPIARAGRPGWLLESLGPGFTCLVFGTDAATTALPPGIDVCVVGRDIEDPEGLLATRYDARAGTTYLLRPDQHVAARWRSFEPTQIRAAWRRSLGFVE